MQNDDHTSIKYLMKELDPAEAVRFEQRMMEDEELLAEVECMRRTLRRLENMPVKRPPSELTEYIVRKACSRNCSSHFRKWWLKADRSLTKYYAAAALIIVGMGIGLLSFQFEEGDQNPINVKQTVTRADIAGSPGFTGQQSRPLQPADKDLTDTDPASNANPAFNGLLDTVHFQEFETPNLPTPLNNNQYQQTGTIQFTGANR